jgi:hypothetical protein
MGDDVIVGEEDKEAVEAEDDDEDNDEGMEEMEIKGRLQWRTLGRGSGGRRQVGETTATHKTAVVSHLAAAVGWGGGIAH